MIDRHTLYDILGVEPNAPAEKIKAIYRLRSRRSHPDRNQDNPELQQHLNGAYEILSDPDKRSQYNQNLGLPPQPRDLKPGQPIYEEIQVTRNQTTQQIPFSFSRWEPCFQCWGDGCPRCQGKGHTLEVIKLTVSIPADVTQVVVPHQGARAEPGGSRGDLIVYVVWR